MNVICMQGWLKLLSGEWWSDFGESWRDDQEMMMQNQFISMEFPWSVGFISLCKSFTVIPTLVNSN